MDDNLNPDAPKAPRLYLCISVAYWLCFGATVFAAIVYFGNGLDSFLHAPIGIKDNYPVPPSAELAGDLLLPLVILYFALRILRWISKEMGVASVVWTVAWVVFVAVLVSAILGQSRWHYEFIPGSVWLFEKAGLVFGLLMGVGIVLLDGLIAWDYVEGLLRGKHPRTVRSFSIATGFTISTLLLVSACLCYVLSVRGISGTLAGYGVLLGIVGLILLPKEPKKQEPAPANEAVSREVDPGH